MNSTTSSTIRGSVWFLVLGLCCLCHGQVIYVDAAATGANTGCSWQDACQNLQDALAAAKGAATPVEIRVAQGLYKPDQGAGITPGDRAATFQLLNGVTLKGGYTGSTAADPNARDVELYETILSGDLAANDVEVSDPCQFSGETEPTWADNSVHIVTGSGTDATAGLDGFTITAGFVAPPSPWPESTLVGGAGMCNEAGSPTVVQCAFRANISFAPGGAVHNHDGHPTFSHCVFERNSALVWAGAMYNENAAPTLTGCTFSANVAMGWGGAILSEWYSRPVLKDCLFADNESKQGGAIHNRAASVVELENCRFVRNRAVWFGEGGAIFSDWADLTMTGCTFDQNTAAWGGGAVQMRLGTLLVARCLFTNNAVDTEVSTSFAGGGALRCEHSVIATLSDTRFEGNVAGNGGAVHTNGYHMDVTRCSFVGNVV